jgi:hypothetical protein
MKKSRTATYRFYMLAELAEKALNARLDQMFPGVLVNGHLEPIPVEKSVNFDEYFEMREIINPSLKFRFEKRFWIGPALDTAALSYLLTFSGFTEKDEQEYLAGMRDDEKIIISWEQADRPVSFRWVLDFFQKQITIPNLRGELHPLSFNLPSHYCLSIPRLPKPLHLTGIVDGASEKRFSSNSLSNSPVEPKNDILFFELVPGEKLLFWAKRGEFFQKNEIVATGYISCLDQQEIVIEQEDGISIEVLKK